MSDLYVYLWTVSCRLSRVLADIGVDEEMTKCRRRAWLSIETMDNFYQRRAKTFYHFGSQSEGTTTLGMDSDVDLLINDDKCQVILDFKDWKLDMNNLLVVKQDCSPPQHCYLQILRPDIPTPATENQVEERDVFVDENCRVFMANTIQDHQIREDYRAEFVKHGPSKSVDEDIDVVYAYHCASLPEECQFMFKRPRKGHWPTEEIFASARKCGTFLVPQGHAESYDSNKEWRFSTSTIERTLMFAMNITQIKVYVLLKMIRKSLLKPIFGDRFSTFDMKTTVLFTMETCPSDIWQENNLLCCTLYCLQTLRGFIRKRYIPHFTISNVNLFVGKLSKRELLRLEDIIQSMIDNKLICVYHIDMDDLGRRMSAFQCNLVQFETAERIDNQRTIASSMRKWVFSILLSQLIQIQVDVSQVCPNEALQRILSDVRHLFHLVDTGSQYEQIIAKPLIHMLFSHIASVNASEGIKNQRRFHRDSFGMYSLACAEVDVLSSRLKFASLCFCLEQYDTAKDMLDYCEGLLDAGLWQICGCSRQISVPAHGNVLLKVLEMAETELLRTHVAFSVVFGRHELYCMPEALVYEMYRTIDDDDMRERIPIRDGWMDLAIVDPIPFLYYLQYITFKQLDQSDNMSAALHKLEDYVMDHSDKGCHAETAANLLGHCYELAGDHWAAYHYYCESREKSPNNNAAHRHIHRLKPLFCSEESDSDQPNTSDDNDTD
ncbi:uncharacterized protein LOC128226862 [Mya arenaria]|uniref:uncharacterized protein LOC128226862 n=1 Tax=Mya arenaria TaxID=6604 RepID=UPI0022DEAE7D|nr:uncharacterized protein LOC128226862 [Mya arenaria]